MGVVALGSERPRTSPRARVAPNVGTNLTLQVLVTMALGVLVGWLYPEIGRS